MTNNNRKATSTPTKSVKKMENGNQTPTEWEEKEFVVDKMSSIVNRLIALESEVKSYGMKNEICIKKAYAFKVKLVSKFLTFRSRMLMYKCFMHWKMHCNEAKWRRVLANMEQSKTNEKDRMISNNKEKTSTPHVQVKLPKDKEANNSDIMYAETENERFEFLSQVSNWLGTKKLGYSNGSPSNNRLALRSPKLSEEYVSKKKHFKKVNQLNRKIDNLLKENEKWKSLATSYENRFGIFKIEVVTPEKVMNTPSKGGNLKEEHAISAINMSISPNKVST